MVLKLEPFLLARSPDKKEPSETRTASGNSPSQPPGMIPVINSTSRANMALISNALAAYTYISGRRLFVKSNAASQQIQTYICNSVGLKYNKKKKDFRSSVMRTDFISVFIFCFIVSHSVTEIN